MEVVFREASMRCVVPGSFNRLSKRYYVLADLAVFCCASIAWNVLSDSNGLYSGLADQPRQGS